jgi:hypothetical protein
MTDEKNQSLGEWTSQINGAIETFALAYGALVATHTDPEGCLRILEGILARAKTQEASKDISPAQQAYINGTKSAVSQLVAAVEIARQVKLAESGGPKH